ncbi:hypothetical protein [Vibrio sp. D431a]|uniref:hypothetical protein n=1 Tax=Vibrio sp. D431a TaxID=2837388 RepID=UPI002553D9D2|nr:hypothetical protein [Vibrio sp. D431a]MDK9789875.1 hypothetical protein [Vibrio sp. D431a]
MTNKTTITSVRNKSIPYRDGDFTSKLTLHPELYKAYVLKCGSEKKAKEKIKELAILACRGNYSPSSYVREQIIFEMLPSHLRLEELKLDLVEIPFSFNKENEIDSGKKGSRVTIAQSLAKLSKLIDNDLEKNWGYRPKLRQMLNETYTECGGKAISFHFKTKLIKQFILPELEEQMSLAS